MWLILYTLQTRLRTLRWWTMPRTPSGSQSNNRASCCILPCTCPPGAHLPEGSYPDATPLGLSVPAASRLGAAPIPTHQRWQELGLRHPSANLILCMWSPFPQIFQNSAVCKPPPGAAWEYLQPFCFASPNLSQLVSLLLAQNPCPLHLSFCPNLAFCLPLFALVLKIS